MWLSPRFSPSTTSGDGVDEQDAAAGVGEGLRERHADVAGADHGDVPDGDLGLGGAHAREGYRAAATRSLAYPSP